MIGGKTKLKCIKKEPPCSWCFFASEALSHWDALGYALKEPKGGKAAKSSVASGGKWENRS